MPFSSHINALPLSHEPRPPSFVTEGNRKGNYGSYAVNESNRVGQIGHLSRRPGAENHDGGSHAAASRASRDPGADSAPDERARVGAGNGGTQRTRHG